MLAVLGDYQRCCAVVVDRGTARAWELYLGRVRDTGLREQLRAPRSNASNERRHGNRAEELEKRHFRQVAEALERLQRANRYDLLAVGGHASEVPRFLGLLPDALRERVAGTFSVDDDSVAPATVRAHAEAILDGYELDRQRSSVAEVLATEAAGGPAVVGIARVPVGRLDGRRSGSVCARGHRQARRRVRRRIGSPCMARRARYAAVRHARRPT